MRIRYGSRLYVEHNAKRLEFIQTILYDGTSGRNIFLSDEKVYILKINANCQ